MRILYFDCFAGISGDLSLGALIDAGVSPEHLQREIEKLSLDPAPRIEVSRSAKGGISAAKVRVIAEGSHNEHRHLSDIEAIIRKSELSAWVKDTSIRIFRNLGEAEASVHGCPLDHVHFHEVGAVDAIVDIVGAAVCLEFLGVEKILASPLPTFTGTVRCAHGIIPLPAPAALVLMKGIPLRECGAEKELVTPTGAAIVSTLAESFGPMPAMKVSSMGYGAGDYELPFPNVLRVVIGDAECTESEHGEVVVIETNVDDMNPQDFDRVFEVMLDLGALDVFVQPVHMKKNRPGFLLQVLCEEFNFEKIVEGVFRETTTIGLRYHRVLRRCLERRFDEVETPFGAVRIKTGILNGGIQNIQPEYEDCRKAAVQHGASVKDVRDAAVAAFLFRNRNPE